MTSSTSESSELKSNTTSSSNPTVTVDTNVNLMASELMRLNKVLGETHKNIGKFEQFVKNFKAEGASVDAWESGEAAVKPQPDNFSTSFQVEQQQLHHVLKDLAAAVHGLNRIQQPLLLTQQPSQKETRVLELETELLEKQKELELCQRALDSEREQRLKAEERVCQLENNVNKEESAKKDEMPVKDVIKVNKASQTKGLSKSPRGLRKLSEELRSSHEQHLSRVRVALLQIQTVYEESESNYKRILNHLGLEIDITARFIHLLMDEEDKRGVGSKEPLNLLEAPSLSAWFQSVKLISQWLRSQIVNLVNNDSPELDPKSPWPSINDNYEKKFGNEVIEETVKRQEQVVMSRKDEVNELIERISTTQTHQ